MFPIALHLVVYVTAAVIVVALIRGVLGAVFAPPKELEDVANEMRELRAKARKHLGKD